MHPQGFSEVRQKISQRVDRLGMPIDRGILDTVTILSMYGVNTVGSCEGHIDRVTGGPYVMFEAPGAKKYVEGYRAVSSRLSSEYKVLYEKATEENIHEVQKVLVLLEGFYKERIVPNSQRIIVRCFGPTTSKLMCQGADLAHILDRKNSKDLLERNQLEMNAFTDYLKQNYS